MITCVTYICPAVFRKCEATDVQAVNDFILFTVAGIGSLASGAIYSSGGWFVLIYVATCMMLFNIVLFSVAWTLKKVIDDAVDNADDADTDEIGRGVRDSLQNSIQPPHTAYNAILETLDEKATPQFHSNSNFKSGRISSRSSSKSYTEHFMMPTPTSVDETEVVRSISVA